MKKILLIIVSTIMFSTITNAEKMTPNIVNGSVANPAEFPFYVGLQSYNASTKKWTHFCGGTLISVNRVLTAAHCLDDMSSQIKYRVHYIESISKPNKNRAKRFYLGDVEIHPSYSPGYPYYHDLAIIKFDRPLPYSYYNRLSWLPDDEITLEYSEENLFSIIGKGSTTTIYAPSNKLLETDVDFTEEALFFAARDQDSGACYGDSGGGLFKKTKGKYYLYGVSSYISGPQNDICQYNSNTDIFYTRIRHPMNYAFIVEHTEGSFIGSKGSQYEFFMDPRYNNTFVNDDWATADKFCELQGYDEAGSYQSYCMEDEDDYYQYQSGSWLSKETGSKNQCYLVMSAVYCKTED